MIISCNNCHKKFNIDENLIPEKGRLLQCNSCDHKWFFKKNIINKVSTLGHHEKQIEVAKSNDVKLNITKNQNSENLELLDNDFKSKSTIEKDYIGEKIDKVDDASLTITTNKNKKDYNILGLIIVFIMSFIGLIIVLDTFQVVIGNIVPNIEFLLYNLYESINDIRLFLKDLI